MEAYKLPNGMTVMLTGTPEENERHKKLVEGRHKFNLAYIRKRGWSMDTITIEQVMEIRAQPGWENPD